MAPNFEAVESVLLQMCGQICRSLPYPCIFVVEVVPLLGEMTDKLVLTFVCGRNLNISNDLGKKGAQWLSGRVLDSRPKGSGFEPHRRHCVVVLEQDTFILA